MKNRSIQYVLLLFFLLGIQHSVTAQEDRETINTIRHQDDGSVLLSDFENNDVGEIPADWYNQKGEKRPYTYAENDKKGYKYSVEIEEGDKFLRYNGINAKHLNFPLGNKDLNIYETPILSWRWRILNIPKNADDEDNDVAASIYVVFDLGRVLFKKVPKSIRYTWSSNLEKGTEFSKFFGNQKVVVMGGGPGSGKWQTFQRNIVEDYKRLFGDDPPETPLAILILSDGDDTGEIVKADYDDLLLLPSKN